jgi:plastocyanin
MRLVIVAAVLAASLTAPGVLFAQEPAAPADQPPTTTTTGTPTTTTPAPDPTPVDTGPVVSVSSDPQGRGAKAAASSSNGVTIKNFKFLPKTLKISTGDTVTWTNKDSIEHDATAKKGGEHWTSKLKKGKSGSHTFDQAGTFDYYCSIHPDMKGTIEVKGSSSGGGGGGGSKGGSGGNSKSGSSGGTSPTTSDGFTPTTGTGSETTAGTSPTAGGSSSTLPKTGLPALPLVVAGLALLALGGLARWGASALYYRGW